MNGTTKFYEILAIFKEAYELFCSIVTIPSSSISTEQSFSCLKRIKTFLRNTMAQDRFTNFSKISIEKELLSKLINVHFFYDDIIYKFAILKDNRELTLCSRNKMQLCKCLLFLNTCLLYTSRCV